MWVLCCGFLPFFSRLSHTPCFSVKAGMHRYLWHLEVMRTSEPRDGHCQGINVSSHSLHHYISSSHTKGNQAIGTFAGSAVCSWLLSDDAEKASLSHHEGTTNRLFISTI